MIKIQKTHEDATFVKAIHNDTGYDLTACDFMLKSNGLIMMNLGVKVEAPKGYYFQIVPRSSFAKSGFVMANGLGIIDEGYRGQWYFGIRPIRRDFIEMGSKALEDYVKKTFIGTRVCQAILRQNIFFHEVKFVDELSETERGERGFGSSG